MLVSNIAEFAKDQYNYKMKENDISKFGMTATDWHNSDTSNTPRPDRNSNSSSGAVRDAFSAKRRDVGTSKENLIGYLNR